MPAREPDASPASAAAGEAAPTGDGGDEEQPKASVHEAIAEVGDDIKAAVRQAKSAFKLGLFRRQERLKAPPEGDAPPAEPDRQPLRTPAACLAPRQLAKQLTNHRLFEGCSERFIFNAVEKAERRTIAAGEVLEDLLFDGGPLLVVEKGALQVTVGPGPPVHFGPGTAWNTVGFLGISHEAEPYRPRVMGPAKQADRVRTSGPYEVHYPGRSHTKEDAPALFVDRGVRRHERMVIDKSGLTVDDITCVYSLCPSCTPRAQPADPLTDWLKVQIRGGSVGEVAWNSTEDQGPANFHGGATVLLLTRRLFEEVGLQSGTKPKETMALKLSLASFRDRCHKMSDLWRTVMSRFAWTFMGMPPEITFVLASGAAVRQARPGQLIVEEGTGGEAAEALVLIDEGQAMIEKYRPLLQTDHGLQIGMPIGKLGPGAIIGDLCYLGYGMVRSASVRAKTHVEVLVLPAATLYSALRVFPGAFAGVEHRLREMANFTMNKLPQRTDSMLQTSVFAACGYQFTASIAGSSERLVYVGGQIIVPRAKKTKAGQTMLFVVQQGHCVAETPEDGIFQEFGPGTCFTSGPTPLGTSDAEGSQVRCTTAVCVLLCVSEKLLLDGIARHFGGKHPPCPVKQGDRISLRRTMLRMFVGMSLFAGVNPEFLEALARVANRRCYMPGQTIAIEGCKDSRMVMVIAGVAVPDRLHNPTPGGDEERGVLIFGEMSMLGAVWKNRTTMRALTYCSTSEINTAGFLSVVSRFPGEESYFEEYVARAIAGGQLLDAPARWPFLKDDRAPVRMINMINLRAERPTIQKDDDTIMERAKGAAILVLQGTVGVYDKDGRELYELSSGECYNEQTLLLTDDPSESAESDILIAKSLCEVQFLTNDLWQSVADRFPNAHDLVRRGILKTLAARSARKLGVNTHSAEVLRMSKLFQMLSLELAQSLCKKLDTQMVLPGEYFTQAGKYGDLMMIILSGRGSVERGLQRPIGPGTVLGEEMLLGLAKLYPSSIKADTVCTMQILKRDHFKDALKKFERDTELLVKINNEAKYYGDLSLREKFQRIPSLANCSKEFLQMLCKDAEDVYYPPGAYIIEIGEPCSYGKTPLFVMMAGRGAIENADEVLQNHVGPGDLIGEGGALGLSAVRMSQVKAIGRSISHCVKIAGSSLEAALTEYAWERDPMEAVMDARVKSNQAFKQKRKDWLEGAVIPALLSVTLFQDAPREFVEVLGARLTDGFSPDGERITVAGAMADSMLILVDGDAVVEDRNGKTLGTHSAGAAISELAVLGLVPQRMSTLRAVGDVKYIVIETAIFNKVLSLAIGAPLRDRVEQRKAQIRRQAEQGLPLVAVNKLTAHLTNDDAAVASVALQSERVALHAGGIYKPVSDQHPSGPHYFVLVSGRAVLEIEPPPDSQSPSRSGSRCWTPPDPSPGGSRPIHVLMIFPGYLLVEGLAANFRIRMVALTACEGYSFQRVDFDMAVASAATAQKWLPVFRMVEADNAAELSKRSSDATGVAEVFLSHANDAEIHRWKERKRIAVSLAESRALADTRSEWSSELSRSPSSSPSTYLQKSPLSSSPSRRSPQRSTFFGSTGGSRRSFGASRTVGGRPLLRNSSAPELRRTGVGGCRPSEAPAPTRLLTPPLPSMSPPGSNVASARVEGAAAAGAGGGGTPGGAGTGDAAPTPTPKKKSSEPVRLPRLPPSPHSGSHAVLQAAAATLADLAREMAAPSKREKA